MDLPCEPLAFGGDPGLVRQPGHLFAVLPQLFDQCGVLLVLPYHPLDPQPEECGQGDPEQRRQQHEQHGRAGGAALEPHHRHGEEIAEYAEHEGRPGRQAHHQHRDDGEQGERAHQIGRGGDPEQHEETDREDGVPPVALMTEHQRPPEPGVPGHDQRQRADGDQARALRGTGGEHQPRGHQIADHEVAVPQPEPTHPRLGRAPRLTRHRVSLNPSGSSPTTGARWAHRAATPPRHSPITLPLHPRLPPSAAVSTDRWTPDQPVGRPATTPRRHSVVDVPTEGTEYRMPNSSYRMRITERPGFP